jgi:amino acid transporter
MTTPGKNVADFAGWQAGHYQELARSLGGEFLASWVLVAASVGTIGQFQALISGNSYSIQAQAQLGWIPKVFAKNSEYDTPTVGILMTVGAVLLMTTLDFMSILQMLNSVYCLSEIWEFAAFIYLRYKYPNLHRPFRVPLEFGGCVLLLVCPVLFLLGIFALPMIAGRWQVLVYVVVVIFVGNVLYVVLEYGRARKFLTFIRKPPNGAEELVAIYETPEVASSPRKSSSETRPFVLG